LKLSRITPVSLLLAAIFTITACGGKHQDTPGSNGGKESVAAVRVSAIPGSAVYPKNSNVTTASNYGFSPLQTLGAMIFQIQTPVALTLNQSFSGLCAQVNSNTVNFLPGLGGITSTENCSNPFRNFVNPGEGAPIIGDGTIGGTNTPVILTGAVSGGDANSGKVEIFENTANGPVSTGIIITLGTNRRVIMNSTPVVVHDGNYLAAKLTSGNGQIISLNLLVLKQ
jgi:hypothetical protein